MRRGSDSYVTKGEALQFVMVAFMLLAGFGAWLENKAWSAVTSHTNPIQLSLDRLERKLDRLLLERSAKPGE